MKRRFASNLSGQSEWLYGIVGGIDLAKTTSIMAALQGTSRTNFTRDVLTVNDGLRQTLSEDAVLICSLGHKVRAPSDQSLALIGYFGRAVALLGARGPPGVPSGFPRSINGL